MPSAEPNAHYIGDGCVEGQEHVIIADGPPVCRVCIRAGASEAYHREIDRLLPPWHPQ